MFVARGIGATAPKQRVSAGTAFENIVVVVTVQDIIKSAAPQILDVVVDIACCIANVKRRIGEVRSHGRARVLVACSIVATTAVKVVAASAAFESVIAGIADQRIVKAASSNILEATVAIALRIAGVKHISEEVHNYGRARVLVTQGVNAEAADHDVSAAAAFNNIGAFSPVSVVEPDQKIAKGASPKIFDAAIDIARRIA